jgi:hypothetical protein
MSNFDTLPREYIPHPYGNPSQKEMDEKNIELVYNLKRDIVIIAVAIVIIILSIYVDTLKYDAIYYTGIGLVSLGGLLLFINIVTYLTISVGNV